MKVRVFKVDGSDAMETDVLEAADYAAAKVLAKELAKERGLLVRTASLTTDGEAVVYLQDQLPPAAEAKRPPGKPVRQDGVIGRGREIRRRRSNEQSKGKTT